MVDKTIFAVSADESRYNLTGVFLTRRDEEEGKNLRMVATDGYRLSLIDRPLKKEIEGVGEWHPPSQEGAGGIDQAVWMKKGNEVWVKLKNNNFIVKKDNVVLIMRLLDAEFPDYQQVIPVSNQTAHPHEKKSDFGIFAAGLHSLQ